MRHFFPEQNLRPPIVKHILSSSSDPLRIEPQSHFSSCRFFLFFFLHMRGGDESHDAHHEDDEDDADDPHPYGCEIIPIII